MTGPDSFGWVAPPVFDPAAAIGKASERKPILVALPLDLAEQAELVAADIGFLLDHAANIFGLLKEGITSGAFRSNDQGVASVAAICERAFRDMANKEGEVLDKVAAAIRAPMKASAQAQYDALGRHQEEPRRAAQP